MSPGVWEFCRRLYKTWIDLAPSVLLACRAVGLGASLTTAHIGKQREIDDYLGLAEETPSCALIPIGWPIGKYGTPPRRPVDECLFFERYDAQA